MRTSGWFEVKRREADLSDGRSRSGANRTSVGANRHSRWQDAKKKSWIVTNTLQLLPSEMVST